jgi:hypothetical protein
MVKRTEAKNFQILVKGSAAISFVLIFIPFTAKLKPVTYQMMRDEATGKRLSCGSSE